MGDGDDDMLTALHFKAKKHKDNDADGDIFDTSGKGDKKLKSIENKFKPELQALKKLLRENEGTVKNIQDFMTPFISSKARGSSKLISDMFAALNSANNNRLSTLKEISNLKKTAVELKLKMKAREDGTDIPADQFGSKLFTELFNQGRNSVIQEADAYQPDISQYANTDKSIDEIYDERLAHEDNDYRSEDGNKMIAYEALAPQVCIEKSKLTGEIRVVAIDKDGNYIEDYPVPKVSDLGTLSYNNDTGTATDCTGRLFKVIDVD